MKSSPQILIAAHIKSSPEDFFPPGSFIYEPEIPTSDILIKYNNLPIIIVRAARVLDEHFFNHTSFKTIGTISKGVDHIDISSMNREITIYNSDTGNTNSAAEHTLALLLASAKGIITSDKLIRAGNFHDLNFQRKEISGKTIGIIGYGKIGSLTSKLCAAFNMNIIANDIDENVISRNPDINFKSVKTLMEESDFVSIHIPNSKSNFHFIDSEKLSYLKKDAVIINTSRGAVIDEAALITHLKQNPAFTAALDVFENEPYINPELFTLQNVILTNHIAGKTPEAGLIMEKDVLSKISLLL